MFLARNDENKIIKPTKSELGFCPVCNAVLIPKLGRINVHHWAHVSDDCDLWSEGETAWHLGWKMLAGLGYCEIPFEGHRADIVIDGRVVELQHSPISESEVLERQKVYGPSMIWVIDASDFGSNFEFRFTKFASPDDMRKWREASPICDMSSYEIKRGIKFAPHISSHTFRWKYPRKTLWECKNLFLDFGDQSQNPHKELFQVKKVHPSMPCGGWGIWWTKAEFVERYLVPKKQIW